MNKYLIFFVIFFLTTFTFSSCEKKYSHADGCPSAAYFIKFTHEEYKNHIICIDDHLRPKTIFNYPRREPNKPYFYNFRRDNVSAQTFDLCNLADDNKYIELHGGYYIAYPYTSLIAANCVLEAQWRDICTIDLNQATVLSDTVFSEMWSLTYYQISNLVDIKVSKITIEDIVNLFNKIIDTNNIDKYCIKVSQLVYID